MQAYRIADLISACKRSRSHACARGHPSATENSLEQLRHPLAHPFPRSGQPKGSLRKEKETLTSEQAALLRSVHLHLLLISLTEAAMSYLSGMIL